MMRRYFLTVTFFFLSFIFAFAQSDKVLMTIGGHEVSLEEFERIYNKNNVAGLYEKQPVEEYVDLFVNFKLKVIEAESLGMDTTSSFKNELSGYRDQLAKPYMNDSASQEELMMQEYVRSQKELHVSHILLRLDQKADPGDTLRVYNKIMDIRKRIMDGEPFDKVARETSEDPSVDKNGGDIGWMTAFRTVWEFENAIYNTPVNQVSMPIRTMYGYHIAKVWEQRPGQGTVQVAHIYFRAPEDMNPEMKAAVEKKVQAVYDSLMNGEDFAKLADHNSDDRSSAKNGGELPWFGSGQMIPEFEKAAFSLQNVGDISKPLHSFYGWHIMMLLGKKGLGSYEDMRPELLSKIGSAPIATVKQKTYVNKLKKEYGYSFNKENFDMLSQLIDTSIFSGKWSDSLLMDRKEVIFSIGPKNYSIADFAANLKAKQRKTDVYSVPVYLKEQFDLFNDDKILSYEKDMLADKYPDFRYIMQEYHDGILLFDLTDKMVWSKAVQDSAGLEKFYGENKANYVWGKRADVMVFSSDSAELLASAKALAVKYGKKKKFSRDFVLEKVCKDDSIKNCITIKEALFEKGDNTNVDNTNWVIGTGENFESDGKLSFIYVKRILEPEIKKLDEARGIVTADYQNFLEKKWIEELRAKYPVQVDYELLKTIK